MIIANQHYREYSTTTVCLRWKIPLTKNILVIMKSGNSGVSRRKKLILEDFWLWLEQQGLVRNTCMNKALDYVLNCWDTAETYLEDGRCCFTNNLSENVIQRICC